MSRYLWDQNKTRYTLVMNHPGQNYNWLFIPGGAGADASYFLSLIELLKLPGNSWLIDFPGNGSNNNIDVATYNYDDWSSCYLDLIQTFPNSIVVGHSFGGMLPLLHPETEHLLKGLVILNSSPTKWFEEAEQKAKSKKLPSAIEQMMNFTNNPSKETFHTALMAYLPYYFSPDFIEVGKKLLGDIAFNYHASLWCQKKANEDQLSAVWFPTNLKTLIIGGTEDCVTPYALFERDTRFNQPCVTKHLIQDAGHAPWVEKPEEVKDIFSKWLASI